MNKTIFLWLAIFSVSGAWSQGKEKVVVSKVTDVVVFTAGAQITHLANTSLKSGENVIRVMGLPAGLDASSIQVAGNSHYKSIDVWLT